MVLLGNMDGNKVLCRYDLRLVRKEVDRCLRGGMEGGEFILSIAGSAHEGVLPEALIEMCCCAQQIGAYR